MKENKVSQLETRTVLRSTINFASYNPRTISDVARKKLKANIRKLGLMGGIVWNEDTGNLVAGHQRIAIIDEVNGYDKDPENNDYEIKVEVAHLDEKTEKEQNIFMNNKAVQGDFDYEELKNLINDVDYQSAGLEKFDLEMMGIQFEEPPAVEELYTPWSKEEIVGDNEKLKAVDELSKEAPENKNIDRSVPFAQDTVENQIERHNEMAKIKDRIVNSDKGTETYGAFSYVVLNFSSIEEREMLMSTLGYGPEDRYVEGREFFNRVEFGVDEDE